jgi:propionyl-CoA carboxylase beta chain
VAWPTAQIAVTGAAGAVSILYRKELAKYEGDELANKRAELQQEYEDTLCNPYIAADRGYIDGVIPPSHTRGYVGRALRLLETKREAVPARKHGNIPL